MNEELLRYITGYIQEHGYPPSVREIAEGVGVSSTDTVHRHIKEMLISEMLETDAEPGAARAIRVPGWKFVRDE